MKPDNRHSHSNATVSIPAEYNILRDKDSTNNVLLYSHSRAASYPEAAFYI
jgi:hypothetical protein